MSELKWEKFHENPDTYISNTGMVVSTSIIDDMDRNLIVKTYLDGNKNYQDVYVKLPHLLKGYLAVKIGNKQYSVHRLVAENFVDGETEEENQVHHKNGNRFDNRSDNLQWVTQKDNNDEYNNR